jgi:cobalt/nickel transport system permease protein
VRHFRAVCGEEERLILQPAAPEALRPGRGPLDKVDARAKLISLLVFLIIVSTGTRNVAASEAALGLLLAVACGWARVAVIPAFRRAALVLPFTLTFAAISWLAGDPARGLALAMKSYVSCLAAWLVIATTPLPALLRGFESLGSPRFLLVVAQFVYRYLFVISEEARQMAEAAALRGGASGFGSRLLRFRGAAGALAVLFARSYRRAGDIHHAMMARGFQGTMRSLATPRFRAADAAFLAAGCALPLLVRLAAERLAS